MTMKWKGLTIIPLIFWGITTHAEGEDSLGVIGDNLDLYGVLNAFKEAESVEAFEKAINDPESQINNIDLDEDDEVDYIQVIDKPDGDAHAFILRIDMGENESQDVAVVELEKTGDNNATVQIVGDEEIYGADYIIEPAEGSSVTKRLMVPDLVVINVWGWPCVRFVFGPRYSPWASPYHRGHYPVWWKPWHPVRWHVYHARVYPHHAYYHRTTVYRANRAHAVYYQHRRTSARVQHHRHYRQTNNHSPQKAPVHNRANHPAAQKTQVNGNPQHRGGNQGGKKR